MHFLPYVSILYRENSVSIVEARQEIKTQIIWTVKGAKLGGNKQNIGAAIQSTAEKCVCFDQGNTH
jgi:hypothetical protein